VRFFKKQDTNADLARFNPQGHQEIHIQAAATCHEVEREQN
jgi:hypothetical protein